MSSAVARLGSLTHPSGVERLEYDYPVDAASSTDDRYSSPPQTYPGCFGLPYQDHNYGAPPPPTPPATPPPIKVNGNIDVNEEVVVTSDVPPPPPKEEEVDDSITRCICDYLHDDGYMICCDRCSVWQHVECMGIDRNSIPENYFCEECQPRQVDRERAKEIQARKWEFLKTLTHDSSTDTDPEEVNNRLLGQAVANTSESKKPQKIKKKQRSKSGESKPTRRRGSKDQKKEKENSNKEANRKAFKRSIRRLSLPTFQNENAQDPWEVVPERPVQSAKYEAVRGNQYSTDVEAFLVSKRLNGHHNDIADLVTDGLRVQRCYVADVKKKQKCLKASKMIMNGQPVIEYIGNVMMKYQYDKEVKEKDISPKQRYSYVLFYNKMDDVELCIDASSYGNDAKHVRRSCQPNAEVRHVIAGGHIHFIIVATKEIQEGTEVVISLDFDYKDSLYCPNCVCLRNNCPVSRSKKKFLKIKIGDGMKTKHHKVLKSPERSPEKLTIKLPIRSPVKSPPVKAESPTKPATEVMDISSTAANTRSQSAVTTPKPTRRAHLSRQNSVTSNAVTASTQVESSTEEVDEQCEETSVTVEELVVKEQEEPAQEKRKLTREERKMEAIMKAFEKMEKREERRKEALARIEPPKKIKEEPVKKVKDVTVSKKGKEHTKKEKDVVVSTPVKEEIQAIKTEVSEDSEDPVGKMEEVTKEDQEVEVVKEEEKSEEKMEPEEVTVEEAMEPLKEEESVNPPAPVVVEPEPPVEIEVRQTRSATKGKKRKAASKRRTRYSSGARSLEATAPTPLLVDDSSNSVPSAAASCPATPVPAGLDAVTPPSFRFLKTKRHLMNEWLSEKSQDSGGRQDKTEPLEVSVDEDMFVTCLPSPRNGMERLRRNSASCGNSNRTSAVESSAGSAKKRWLRQAMGETPGSESGMLSPIPGPCSGGMSPNSSSVPSPGGSPPADFVTPLKKRRLASYRESLEQRVPSVSTPSMASPQLQTTGSYFSTEAILECKLGDVASKNGFKPFSPFKSSSTEEADVHNFCLSSNNSDIDRAPSPKRDFVESDSSDIGLSQLDNRCQTSAVLESPISVSNKTENAEIAAVDSSDVASSVSTVPSKAEASVVNGEVSTSDTQVRNSWETRSSSEPDSSENVGKTDSHEPMEVECDSANSLINSGGVSLPTCSTSSPVKNVSTPVLLGIERNEVDSSTQEREGNSDLGEGIISVTRSSECTFQEDICDSNEQNSGSNSQENKLSSASSSSEVLNVQKLCSSSEEFNSQMEVDSGTDLNSRFDTSQAVSFSERSQVDSSSDNRQESCLLPLAVNNVVSDSRTSSTDVCTGSSLEWDASVSSGNGGEETEAQANIGTSSSEVEADNSRSEEAGGNIRDSQLTSSTEQLYSVVRQSPEMTVDSTTHSVITSSSTASSSTNSIQDSIMWSRVSPNSYPDASTSVVSSATDVGQPMENSYTGKVLSIEESLLPAANNEVLPSSSSLPSDSSLAQQPVPAKKKVSLQEYRKRAKKPPTAPVSTSSVTKPSSTVTSSSVSAPLNLDRLPTLAPLPLFEPVSPRRTERKEFKSSSDLLSPIFNRKEKKEEVRKPMSLSERLKHEFGLDDSEEEETKIENQGEGNNESGTFQAKAVGGSDPPPPPPPPSVPRPSRTTSPFTPGSTTGTSRIPSLLSLQTFPTRPLQSQTSAGGGTQETVAAPKTPPLVDANLLSKVSTLASTLTQQLQSMMQGRKKTPSGVPPPPPPVVTGVSPGAQMVPPPPPPQKSPISNNVGGGMPSFKGTTTSNKQVYDYGHQSTNGGHGVSPSGSGHSHHLSNSNSSSSGGQQHGSFKLSPGGQQLGLNHPLHHQGQQLQQSNSHHPQSPGRRKPFSKQLSLGQSHKFS